MHVINRLGRGGAEKQLQEIVSRSDLDQQILELDAGTPKALIRLGRELRRRKADVVVAWLDRPQIAVAVADAPRSRLIASVRGLPRRPGLKSRWSLRAAIARYDRVVTNSEAARMALLEFMRPLRAPIATVIPNGVEFVGGYKTGIHSPLRVGYIGRANPDKGFDVMLAALSQPTLPDVHAVLIGAGVPEATAAHREALPSHEVHPSVADPWSVAGELDVLVVPSRNEGLPNVVLEAFARAVPVVATDAGGTSELVSPDRGDLVPPEDPASIAAAIRRIHGSPPHARDRAAKAQRHVRENFNWERVVKLWNQLIFEVASDR